jgi:hypothetical protein
MEPVRTSGDDTIEVVPVVVVSQSFPARPSSIPEIRDFVRTCLAQSPLDDEDSRNIFDNVSRALLDAAGPNGSIQVSFRIFPDHVEVDVLRSQAGAGGGQSADSLATWLTAEAGTAARNAGPEVPPTFAEWMSDVMRRQGLTMEDAASQLGVSVKTVTRWVGGTTEPRLRDLRRIHDVFGELPFE